MDILLGVGVMLVKMAVVLAVVFGLAAYMILIERKLLGRFQVRYGPNRVGLFGLLQPIADGLKMLLKEDIIPDGVDRRIFLVAPAIVAGAALLAFAVVPFGDGLTLFGHPVPQVLVDTDVGLLVLVALSSLAVYGIALGGWTSDNKYSLLGGIRGAAQMVSYELALGLSLIPVVMLTRSLNLSAIVAAQAGLPFALIQPVAFVIFIISALAETNRIPFDLPEAENELQAGYHTEYSGMRFALFYVGEYVNMILLGSITAVFFLGGWHGPFLPPILWLAIKVLAVPVFLIWTRASLPRLRYDQLMGLGWKVLVPLALVNILVTGAILAAGA
ncbi:NADH dehydrogenase (quinone) [Solidesulfovibrio carbinoliphilus subsp. oakridgensis]|uniref:NADH-quinone oxidoreductase subunit H n=1 Tax=Solidesulfovibrio carbinoliphilus subsp. oakridgensis TaxID=694327 RepID=G7QCY1_9BACT|nr:NADH-quinone oxidoreductase subunit NuoH [Solidesulfovibrio carbinoliphilus]EHJ46287.1 NADH dehydrogenase (quinone) [Solidesulfovibrio carbinoliphilus subsp. oakridgensis]